MNALVTDLLSAGVRPNDQRALVRARLRALGILYEPPRPVGRIPSREEITRLGRGAGRSVSEALERDRSPG